MAIVIENGDKRMVTLPIESKLLQQNIMMITEEISAMTVSEYQQQLMYLMSITKPGEVISIYINTPGGSVYDGLGLYDLMNFAKAKGFIIRTVNIGKACSMGSLLLMAGTKGYRESLPNCSVMVHEISTLEYGKTSEMKDQMKEMERLQKVVDSIITDCADPELIQLSKKTDLWLDAKDSLKYKIIDKII